MLNVLFQAVEWIDVGDGLHQIPAPYFTIDGTDQVKLRDFVAGSFTAPSGSQTFEPNVVCIEKSLIVTRQFDLARFPIEHQRWPVAN